MSDLPTGTVTMLLSDIEGSTALVHRLDAEYGDLLAEYRELLRASVSEAAGHEVDYRADEFFAAFQRAQDGVAAAVAAQQALVRHSWPDGIRVLARMGLHTGEPAVASGVYLGVDLHRAVRICSAAHGGQILLSQTTHDLVGDRIETRDLGSYSLAGIVQPERIFQLLDPQLRDDFPPLRAESASGRAFGRKSPRTPKERQTLAEAAWQVRRMLPETAALLQRPLAELGAALFTGDRALRGVDDFLERVDDRGIARRLVDQRKLMTPRAQRRAQALEKQVSCLERLRDRRKALAGTAVGLERKLGSLHDEESIDSLRGRIVEVTEEADGALDQAARALDPFSYKLARTRHRGIYRSGRRYAVPFVDEAGNEQLREFETLLEARDFRYALRIAEKGQRLYSGATFIAGGQRGGRDAGDYTRGDDGRR